MATYRLAAAFLLVDFQALGQVLAVEAQAQSRDAARRGILRAGAVINRSIVAPLGGGN
jgi:hypothetical protein